MSPRDADFSCLEVSFVLLLCRRESYFVTELSFTVWSQFSLPASRPGPPFPTHLASMALVLKPDVTHCMVALITRCSWLTGDSPHVYTVGKCKRRQFLSSPYTDPPEHTRYLASLFPSFRAEHHHHHPYFLAGEVICISCIMFIHTQVPPGPRVGEDQTFISSGKPHC